MHFFILVIGSSQKLQESKISKRWLCNIINPENICLLTSFSHLPIRRDSSQRPQGTWTGRTAPWHSCSARFDKWSENLQSCWVMVALHKFNRMFKPRGFKEDRWFCHPESSNWMLTGFCWSWDRAQHLQMIVAHKIFSFTQIHHPHRMAGNRHTQTHEPNRSAITWASSSGNIKM